MLGGWEMAVLAGLFGLLFFGKRLPEAARGLGQSVTAFRSGLKEVTADAELPRIDLPRPGDLLADRPKQTETKA
jgi:Sec-independent protein translocase protein TatA